VQALLHCWQIIATSKEMDQSIVAEKLLEVQLLVRSALKYLPAHAVGIARIMTTTEAARDQPADILTEKSRPGSHLQLLVLQPRLLPNMCPTAKQMPQRMAEAGHDIGAPPGVVIRMTTIIMMMTDMVEAEADMLILSIVLHKWQRLELLLQL
jgi:hypothetical protein